MKEQFFKAQNDENINDDNSQKYNILLFIITFKIKILNLHF